MIYAIRMGAWVAEQAECIFQTIALKTSRELGLLEAVSVNEIPERLPGTVIAIGLAVFFVVVIRGQ